MFAGWIQWLSSQHPKDVALLILPLMLLDGVRYIGATLALWVWDFARDLCGYPSDAAKEYEYCPSVCVVLAGLNEADSIGQTLLSVWGTYPRLEIIVVDDGSSDGMAQVAEEFAATHENVLVLRKLHRGGKSSALNFALPFTQADVIICVDTDSHLAPCAIWEIVQPLADERVAGVSGTIIPRNGFTNLCTRLQALEYLRNIFVGRRTAAWLGILGIVSGAFGAFRRSSLARLGGWDVGPGEDGDLVLRLRKQGFRIAFTPYAQCYTNTPTNFSWLFRQRRRWEWAVVTFECRKHVDLGDPLSATFSLTNLVLLLDRWLFSIVLMYSCLIFAPYLAWQRWSELHYILLTQYVAYLAIETAQACVVLYYSLDRWRDLKYCLVLPLMPFYALFIKAASAVAITEELITRRSFQDNFVPSHVRDATWHW
jgi:poly-beta-1,6-N-acetyl-D-glucosamine synthase